MFSVEAAESEDGKGACCAVSSGWAETRWMRGSMTSMNAKPAISENAIVVVGKMWEVFVTAIVSTPLEVSRYLAHDLTSPLFDSLGNDHAQRCAKQQPGS